MTTHNDAVKQPGGVAVLGLGYVGCVTAACLANLGRRVIGVDRDEFKVRCVTEGQAPFYEPGLEAIVAANVAAGRLTATVSTAEALAEAEVVLICVGTPSEKNGDMRMDQLERACREVAEAAQGRPGRLAVAIRSTVFPGTCQRLRETFFSGAPEIAMAANPEFLREGNAVEDFMAPSLLVVGGDETWAVDAVAGVYAGLPVEAHKVALPTAEIIKYACNSFHALKISFANEIGAICGSLKADAREVMEIVCADTRLNISPAYLKPGFAFGGSCLPKDLRALMFRSTRLDLKLPLLGSVLASNEEHLRRAVEAVLELPQERLGIYGLAFKASTDDLRESPAVTLIEQLIGKGRQVRVYDPHIRLSHIYGSNRTYLEATLPHIERSLDTELGDLLGWAQCVILTQAPGAAQAAQIQASGLPVLDFSGAFEVTAAAGSPGV